MKRIYLSIVVILALATSSILQAAVIPYLPPLQSFGGTPVDLATFLPSIGNYTLEVQGTVGVQISIAGGVLTYTPATNGVVRFSQKNGKVYVYEGNVYMTTLTPVWSTTYPAIADATADTDANNLLQNASFETTGTLVGGTNYNFGTPWVTNITVAASGGIRITNATAGNVNGTYECVWRGSGNTNYFAQQLASTIKPNTSYKVIVRQIASGNASATFNLGLGSTVNGLEYGFTPLILGGGTNTTGTYSGSFRTPSSVSVTSYFTFKNTATNTASSGSDPVAQFDYLALVEGVDVPGITGVSSASLLNGNAYAPGNVSIDFAAGDTYDMTGFIVNPTIEGTSNAAVPTGWTIDKGTGNTFTTTGQHYSGITTNRYLDSWNGTAGSMLYTAQQTITGIPNGFYKLSAAARTSGVGSYIVSKTSGKTFLTEIINNGSTGGTLGSGFNTIIVDAIVSDNTLTIAASTSATFTGGTAWAGTWFSADDFVLSYFGERTLNATVNDEGNGRMLFTSVGQSIDVPVTTAGYLNGFTVTSDNDKFEVQTPTLPSTGGTVTVRFIGNLAGDYSGNLTITSTNPSMPTPGLRKVSGSGTTMTIPMVATITTELNNAAKNDSKVFISGNNVIAQFTLNAANQVEMNVYNVNGMLIASEKQMLNAGANQLVLNTNISNGVYFVKLNIDGEVSTTKLVK